MYLLLHPELISILNKDGSSGRQQDVKDDQQAAFPGITIQNNQTYPSILIENYSGKGKIKITLVTKMTHTLYPHDLMEKDCKDG